jgi:hypothetical protein
LKTKQNQAVRDHNLNSKKRRLNHKSPCEFKRFIADERASENPILQLKPLYPEQPRKKRLLLNE